MPACFDKELFRETVRKNRICCNGFCASYLTRGAVVRYGKQMTRIKDGSR